MRTLQMLQQRPMRKLYPDNKTSMQDLMKDDFKQSQCTGHNMNDLEFVYKNMQKINFNPKIDKKLNKIAMDFDHKDDRCKQLEKFERLGSELKPNVKIQRFNQESHDRIQQKVQIAKGRCFKTSSASTAINVYKNT